jgi:hypothetical protein
MAKIDELKEIKSDLKEVFRALVYLILALLTGIVTVVYQILIGHIPPHMVIFSGLGLVIAFIISLYALKLWQRMQEINKEMKNVE